MTAPDMSVAPLSPETTRRLRELNDRFTDIGAAERANYQIYLTDHTGSHREAPSLR